MSGWIIWPGSRISSSNCEYSGTLHYTSLISDIFKQKVTQTKKGVSKLFGENADFSTSLGVRAGMYYYGYQVIKKNPVL